MRKIIALLLAAAMAFSLVIVAGATEETDTPASSQQTVKLIVQKAAETAASATYQIRLDASACDGVAALQFRLVPAEGMTQSAVKLEDFSTQFNVPETGSSAFAENGGQYGYTDDTGMYVAFGGNVSNGQCITGKVLVMTITYTFAEGTKYDLKADDFKACKSGSDALTNPYDRVVEYEDATTPTPSTLKGDVNGDGVVNIGDQQALFEHLQGIRLITDPTLLANAEVTGNNEVDIGDQQLLFEYLQGISQLS